VRYSFILKSVLGLACMAWCVATPASAAPILTGNVTASYLFPDASTVYSSSTFAVGSSLSCPSVAAICNPFAEPATLSASGLAITLTELGGSSYSNGAFNGIQFSGLTFNDGSSITGFVLDSDLPGLTAAAVSFTANSIQYNAQGLAFPNNYHITLNLLTSTAVPEPLTLTVFGAGLAGAAALRRRKAKSV